MRRDYGRRTTDYGLQTSDYGLQPSKSQPQQSDRDRQRHGGDEERALRSLAVHFEQLRLRRRRQHVGLALRLAQSARRLRQRATSEVREPRLAIPLGPQAVGRRLRGIHLVVLVIVLVAGRSGGRELPEPIQRIPAVDALLGVAILLVGRAVHLYGAPRRVSRALA